jgi:D-glycero-alpha-D-manno-heptose 1-phosphate guanylyltransferase
MKMLVLAGGFGTRLRSLVSDVPKPLAPVGSIPFLHYQIENWIAQGIHSYVFLLHHQANLIKDFVEEEKCSLLKDCDVRFVIEPQPLDTGGAVALAVRQLELDGEFIVTNADTWLGAGAGELTKHGADSIVVVRQKSLVRYGMVEINDAGIVLAFREKGESNGPGWINAGMGLLKAEYFRKWDGQRLSLEKDIFPRLLSKRQLRAIPLESDFIDIGVPEDYLRFCEWQKHKREGRLCN